MRRLHSTLFAVLKMSRGKERLMAQSITAICRVVIASESDEIECRKLVEQLSRSPIAEEIAL